MNARAWLDSAVAELGPIYQLPRLDAWTARRLPTRRGQLVLAPWVCAGKDERPMVVRARVLRAALHAVRKRQPHVLVTPYAVEIAYARGLLKLHLHDASAVLGKMFHHYMREQRSLAALPQPLDARELSDCTSGVAS